jgi:transposase-like protein
MAIVWSCALSVEAYAATGKGVEVPRPTCPACQAPMVFWYGYFRPVRRGATLRVFLRRARCRACRVSHALLPSFLLAKRLDSVEVIGPTIEAVATGAGTRRSAREAGVAHETARSWWRRHRTRALAAAGLMSLLGTACDTPPAATVLWLLAPRGEPRRWRTGVLRSCGNWLAPLHQHHLTPAQGLRGGVGLS